MNTSDTIEKIIDSGISSLNILKPGDGKVEWCVGSVAPRQVNMGDNSTMIHVAHQATGATLQDALASLLKQVEAINALRVEPRKLAIVDTNGRIQN